MSDKLPPTVETVFPACRQTGTPSVLGPLSLCQYALRLKSATYAVDSVCVAQAVVDIENEDGVIGIYVNMINVVRWCIEDVAVNTCNEATAGLALLLEVNFTLGIAFRTNDNGVVFLAVCAAYEGQSELVGGSFGGDR